MDYYKILGVAYKASPKEIEAAFDDLAVKYHPDMNPGDKTAEENFAKINKAYSVLKDAKARKEYDLSLSGGSRTAPQTPRPQRGTPAKPGVRGNIAYATDNPLFDMLDGLRNTAKGNATAQANAGQKTEEAQSAIPTIELTLTSREAVAGTTKIIKVNGHRIKIKIKIV